MQLNFRLAEDDRIICMRVLHGGTCHYSCPSLMARLPRFAICFKRKKKKLVLLIIKHSCLMPLVTVCQLMAFYLKQPDCEVFHFNFDKT